MVNVTVIYGAFYDRENSDFNLKELSVIKWLFAHHQIVYDYTLPDTGSAVIDPSVFTEQDCIQWKKHLPPMSLTVTMGENSAPMSVMENNIEYTKETKYTMEHPELEHFFLCPDKRHAVVITTRTIDPKKLYTHVTLSK